MFSLLALMALRRANDLAMNRLQASESFVASVQVILMSSTGLKHIEWQRSEIANDLIL